MNVRAGIILASVAALCACNSDKGGTKANTSTSANTANTASVNASRPAVPADPTLAADVQMAAQLIKGQLPMRQENGVTISAVEAKGTELVLEMQVPQDLGPTEFRRMEEQLPVIACNNPQAQEMFRRGGTYTYRVVDSGGEQFTASVNRCAPGGGS